jgi:hypothetical protein
MAMRKRRSILVGVAVGFGLAGYAGWWLLFGFPVGVNRRGFELIQPGMSFQEVQSMLGRPPWVNSSMGSTVWSIGPDGSSVVLDDVFLEQDDGTRCKLSVQVPPWTDPRRVRFYTWESDETTIWVFFCEEGPVVAKELIDYSSRGSAWLRVKQRRGW